MRSKGGISNGVVQRASSGFLPAVFFARALDFAAGRFALLRPVALPLPLAMMCVLPLANVAALSTTLASDCRVTAP
jgi:hypothetical protein